MSETMKNKMKIAITVAIVGLFIWFLIVSPMITFHKNEKEVERAAKRYFDLYSNELPVGERVKTVSLETLYSKSFMEKDIFIPYTKKTCSITNSWVKVKRVNSEFKYYTYLECGVLTSPVDHKGPEIKLYGDTEITIDLGEKYKEQGIKSVVDNKDGRLDSKDVTVKGKVDTSKVGTYTIDYIAFDNLSNKTTVTRTVTVVQKLASTVKRATGKADYYIGEDPENYVYFSNMLFRIIGIKDDNVKIIADKDIANVNYDGIDEWMKYYENHLTDSAKKLIVPAKYCDMTITDSTLDTTQCNSYSKEKNIGLISIDEINKAATSRDTANYLVGETTSWTGNSKDAQNAYAIKMFVNNAGAVEKKHNYGVRPVISIKADTLIKSGNGTMDHPYILEDYMRAKKSDLNERYTGEYITYGGLLWRIIETNSDGTTKVICEQTLKQDDVFLTFTEPDGATSHIYNPNKKDNIGYFINNRSSEYIDTAYFVNHNIEVPIYKGEPMYKGEVQTKKYTVKVSAPNMYEMFSAAVPEDIDGIYKLINSSQSAEENPGVNNLGSVAYSWDSMTYDYGVRPVAYFNKSVTVNSGKGTIDNPFKIGK